MRNGQAPRGKVFEAIEQIAEATCNLANHLEKQEIEEVEWERSMKRVKTAGKAIGGAAIVSLNAGVLVAQVISPAVATVSGVLGAGLIEATAQEL